MAAGDLIGGRYKLTQMLARGGMGAVWKARHMSLDVDVAVKLMSPLLVSSVEQRTRFAREAKASAQLKSPHVVQIHDYGVDGETPYIVMELLSGEDLGARLRREKRLSRPVTAKLAVQIGRGLRKAHEAGIVHRDLKPANIFLTTTDEDEELVKILDFGIARASGSGDSTLTGELLGSPPYMSPEQARGLKSLDHRTDQWSMAVVLYRMLTGRLPFQGEQAGDVIVKICTETAPPPTSIVPELPRDLDGFFARVFDRDPERRFLNIREMTDAFVALVTPGAVPRPSSPNVVVAPEPMPFVPVGRTTVRMVGPYKRGPSGEPIPVTPEAQAAPLPTTERAQAVTAGIAQPVASEPARAASDIQTMPVPSTPTTASTPQSATTAKLSPSPALEPLPASPAASPGTTLPLPPDPLFLTTAPLLAPPVPESAPVDAPTFIEATTTSGATTRPVPSVRRSDKKSLWIGVAVASLFVGGGGALVVAFSGGTSATAGGGTPDLSVAAPGPTMTSAAPGARPSAEAAGASSATASDSMTGSPSGAAPSSEPSGAPPGGVSAEPQTTTAPAPGPEPPGAKALRPGRVPTAPASAGAKPGATGTPTTSAPAGKRVPWD